jgi:hypothetical protein
MYILLVILLIGCSNKKIQSNSTSENYEQTLNENQERPLSINNTEPELILEREKILKLLRKKGDKILNINNLFEVKIPENIEIVSIDQYLILDRDNTQYGVRNSLYMVYENKFFCICIEIYGNKDKSFFTEDKTYNLKKMVNYDPYVGQNQVKHLKENYLNAPFTNRNKVKIGRFVSLWGTSFTSDYYGLYFKIPNDQFDECIISIDNIWGTYTKNEILDENYKEKIVKEQKIVRK